MINHQLHALLTKWGEIKFQMLTGEIANPRDYVMDPCLRAQLGPQIPPMPRDWDFTYAYLNPMIDQLSRSAIAHNRRAAAVLTWKYTGEQLTLVDEKGREISPRERQRSLQLGLCVLYEMVCTKRPDLLR
jgi:hypothetical protein